jgi:hypothetical protein
MKSRWGVGIRGIAPFIVNLGTERWFVVNFTPWPLLREITPVPIFKRLSGHQNTAGDFGEDSNISSQPAVEQRIAQPGASVPEYGILALQIYIDTFN